MHYTCECGFYQMRDFMNDHLALFGMSLSDIVIFITDMRGNVQKVSRIFDRFSFLCLCHVNNFSAKAFSKNVHDYDTNDDEESEFHDGFADLITSVLSAVKKVKDPLTIEHNATKLQETVEDGESVFDTKQ